jgi:hypothetical protein
MDNLDLAHAYLGKLILHGESLYSGERRRQPWFADSSYYWEGSLSQEIAQAYFHHYFVVFTWSSASAGKPTLEVA